MRVNADGPAPAKHQHHMAPSWRCPIERIHRRDADLHGAVQSGAQCRGCAFPKTKEAGGFQHITSDTLNDGESVWDDTLFMTVLVLANRSGILAGAGDLPPLIAFITFCCIRKTGRTKTGLWWYHGFTAPWQLNSPCGKYSGAAETGHHRHPAAAGIPPPVGSLPAASL